ncbi:MAG: TIGR03767 family metallophosphoesterase, partial [Actinobacteria bacterium]|nr:TIGR03767 family metallophosphoesterase [Actinomycetota bacterium]
MSMDDTTIQTVIARGDANEQGWCELRNAPGEDYTATPTTGEVLGCLWHLSDLHICDAESPSRLEYIDRYSDPDSEFREELGDIGTYRPQEILTIHVALAMIETV